MTALTTSWMWQVGDGINGAKLNVERGVIDWFDSIGCACGDSSQSQPYADFLENGAAFDTLPDDVLAEVRAVVVALQQGDKDQA